MNLKTATTLLVALSCAATTTTAFLAPGTRANNRLHLLVSKQQQQRHVVTSSSSFSQLYASDDAVDDEVERLRSMAAKYRAEASALEAEKAQQMAEATERAFAKFDTNQDGEISLEELQVGLEKILKTELKEERVAQLMKEFDVSGDGALQLDEFKGVGQFARKLEQIVRDEKAAALEAKKAAKKEAEEAALAQAKLEMINDKDPTASDRALSLVPYLLPLLDGLQFGRFLLENNTGNPFVAILATLFLLYRSIPFSGFIAFLALNFLSSNFGINRLIRYNMQQAIYVDIALFVPGLIAGIYTLILSGLGVQAPVLVEQLGNDIIFVTLLAVIAYCVGSSALGITPDKLPFISDRVNGRMPTIDMFDAEGKLMPRFNEENKEDDDKKKD